MTTTPEQVICGHRETRPDGNYECVQPFHHPDRAHYWVRLNTSKESGVSTYMERVCITRSQLEDVDALCGGIVTRGGVEDACCKPATCIIYDAESASIWPACTWHAHRYGGALTLAQIAEAHRGGSVWFEREVEAA